MRTTLDLDEDILLAAKEIAGKQGKTAGKVLSDLARRGLRAPPNRAPTPRLEKGFEVLPADDRVVTSELVRRLLEESEDSGSAYSMSTSW
jgi:hypothetical protein